MEHSRNKLINNDEKFYSNGIDHEDRKPQPTWVSAAFIVAAIY